MAAPRPSLEQAFREAVDACAEADRPDLLDQLLAGFVDILMHPAQPDAEDEHENP